MIKIRGIARYALDKKKLAVTLLMSGYGERRRREGGSNPRSRECRTTVFETAAFDHSAISPNSRSSGCKFGQFYSI